MPIVPQEGDVISSPYLPGIACVIHAAWVDRGVRIKSYLLGTNTYYDRVFQPCDFMVCRPDFGAEGETFRLAVLAERFRHAAQYDPRFAINTARVDPLPHQIQAVYKYLLRSPRVRFLLADDPGAGKTIMAGLLFKELQRRSMTERVLVVTPANLTKQWREELLTKFGEQFSLIESSALKSANADFWRQNPRSIISIDLAKRATAMNTLKDTRWDLVIVDEAHKMAAYEYAGEVDKTKAYQLGEKLSELSDHLLLLTATPHRGRSDNFHLLLSLLEPDLCGTSESGRALAQQATIPIFLRRMKEQLINLDGEPLFRKRTVETIEYRLSGIELDLYREVTDYVVWGYKQLERFTNEQAKRNYGLVLTVLQRRLASSTRAIRTSIERREKRLLQQLRELRQSHISRPEQLLNPDHWEVERERWEAEEQIISQVGEGFDEQLVREEIAWVRKVRARALQAEQEATTSDAEQKLAALRHVLQDPFKNGLTFRQSAEKLLIFTENKDTHDYLKEKFENWNYRVASIHGGMDQTEREEQMTHFKQDAQVMVATEAAGEGINLQFCRLMINYDIPWNPNRLEQRMGRIHRYGQERDVQIYNLVATNTREGYVLGIVLKKLAIMRHDLGSDLVYDVIGDFLPEADLAALIQEVVLRRMTKKADVDALIERRISPCMEQVKAEMRVTLRSALASDAITSDDLDAMRDQVLTDEQQRVTAAHIEQFVVTAFRTLCSGRQLRAVIRPRLQGNSLWQIEHVPDFIRRRSPAGYTIADSYSRIAFDRALYDVRSDIDLVVPGHPLFEALRILVHETYNNLLTQGACFLGSAAIQGFYWLLETDVIDRRGRKVDQWLFCVRQCDDGSFSSSDPLFLYKATRIPASDSAKDSSLSHPMASCAATSRQVEEWTYENEQSPRLQALQRQRLLEADTRIKYLRLTMCALIARQERKLEEYRIEHRGQLMYENTYNIGLRTLEENLEEYRSRLTRGGMEIEDTRYIGANPPRIIGTFICLPPPPGILVND